MRGDKDKAAAGGPADGVPSAGPAVGPSVGIPYVGPAAVQAVSYPDAADALIAALATGLDPARSAPRAAVPVAAGHLLLMPAESTDFVGVKIASVAPDNPGRGLPRIQGSFLLMSGQTLAPVALIDGIALTTLRTPAVSAAAARYLAAEFRAAPARIVVFGTGPQAAGHLRALQAELDLAEVVVIGRSATRSARLAETLTSELAVAVRAGDETSLPDADVVVCATTAREPLFSAAQVRRGVVVIAVGSHEPEAAELDPDLLTDAQVVVEDPATALREAGDVIRAVDAGALDRRALVPLADLVTGATAADSARTRVFKSVGMAWEDVVVAVRVWERQREEGL